MPSVIRGDWTHRRGDAGGCRAVFADIEKPRPTIAWSWHPAHRGHIDQVRVLGEHVIVATMPPDDPTAPGWEHAVVYSLETATGRECARRVLADPEPVAAMVVGNGEVHVVATRKGEPVFWYALSIPDLAPRHRRTLAPAREFPHDDVLDAWVASEGGLWFELCHAEDDGAVTYAYTFADREGHASGPHGYELERAPAGSGVARDACARGPYLFVPTDGQWVESPHPVPPGLSRLDAASTPASAAAQHETTVDPARGDVWTRATMVGPRARLHVVGCESVVGAIVAAEDPLRARRARVEAFGVEAQSGAVKWRAQSDRIALRPPLGNHARVARRPNGEILFQSLGQDGIPCTPLVCARPDGRLDAVLLGARGRYVLDAALGDSVLVHRETSRGTVEVGGFAVDNEGPLLGRRAVETWAIDAGDLGGGTTVYAGAGTVVVRGARGICAVTL